LGNRIGWKGGGGGHIPGEIKGGHGCHHQFPHPFPSPVLLGFLDQGFCMDCDMHLVGHHSSEGAGWTRVTVTYFYPFCSCTPMDITWPCVSHVPGIEGEERTKQPSCLT
jgi:hypothetical protein